MQMNSAWLVASVLLGVFFLEPAPAWQGTHPATGRQIAPVMGMAGADWLARPEREREEQPAKALQLIGLRKGMTVADIGAGVCYFSIRMAWQTGPRGKVYATDIQPSMLELLRENAKRNKVDNIETVLGSPTETGLSPNSIDLALLVDVYHEFSEPQKMLQSIAAALKHDGRLVLLEYRKEDPSVPIREEHKMSIEQVRQELAVEGFVMEKVLHDLPRQHILIFRKKPS